MNIRQKPFCGSYARQYPEGRSMLKAEDAKTAAGRDGTDLFGRQAQIRRWPRKGSFKRSRRWATKAVLRRTKSVEESRREAQENCLAAPGSRTRPAPRANRSNRIYIEDGFGHRKPNCTSRLLVDRQTFAHRVRLLHRGRHGTSRSGESILKNHQLFCRPRRGLPALPRPSRCFRPRAWKASRSNSVSP